jgi:hypothetical protein
MLAALIYDTKPVHILSTAAELVQWIVKEKQVWNEEVGKKQLMKFLQLNMIDEYDNHMNSTNIADQLCVVYRPDH